MNLIQEIVSNAIDMAGASLVDKLRASTASLYVLNAISDMEVQLLQSKKGIRRLKMDVTLAANSQTGVLPATHLEYVYENGIIVVENDVPVTAAFSNTDYAQTTYIRYRTNQNTTPNNLNSWQIIEIVQDIEDLTKAEREGRFAILFGSSFDYQLSFIPDSVIEAEFWGRQTANEAGFLTDISSIPAEFTHIPAIKAALFMLADLLLLPESKMYQAFVQLRSQQLLMRLRDLEHRFVVYRSDANDDGVGGTVRDYNPFLDDTYRSGYFYDY